MAKSDSAAPVDLAEWEPGRYLTTNRHETVRGGDTVWMVEYALVPPAVLATLVAAVRAAIVVREALARHGQGYAVLDQTLADFIDTAGGSHER